MSVTSGGQDLEDAVVNGEKGGGEGSSTEIVDDDLRFATLLVEDVGDDSGGRDVDDAENLKTSDGTCALGGPTLSVAEV